MGMLSEEILGELSGDGIEDCDGVLDGFLDASSHLNVGAELVLANLRDNHRVNLVLLHTLDDEILESEEGNLEFR